MRSVDQEGRDMPTWSEYWKEVEDLHQQMTNIISRSKSATPETIEELRVLLKRLGERLTELNRLAASGHFKF